MVRLDSLWNMLSRPGATALFSNMGVTWVKSFHLPDSASYTEIISLSIFSTFPNVKA